MTKKSPKVTLESAENKLKLWEEKLTKLKKHIQLAIQEIVELSSSRHSANIQDSDVNHLTQLEEKYLTNRDEKNLTKVRTIIITPEYIQIAWLKLDRFDYVIQERKGEWIYEIKWKFFYSYKKALNLTENDKHQTPDLVQWRKIYEAIPWSSAKDRFNNMIKILNLSIYCPDWDYPSEVIWTYFAQIVNKKKKTAFRPDTNNWWHYILLRNGKFYCFDDGCDYIVAIRTIRD